MRICTSIENSIDKVTHLTTVHMLINLELHILHIVTLAWRATLGPV